MNNEKNNIKEYDTIEVADKNNQRISVPYADIHHSADGYYISLDMPGVSKERLTIKYNDGELLVKGDLQTSTSSDSEYYYNEVDYTGYQRSFIIPNDVDPEKIEAELIDGVLKLSLNKKEELKPKIIEIK